LHEGKIAYPSKIREVKRRLGENGRRGDAEVSEEIFSVKKDFLKEWMPRLTSDREPISPYRIVWELMQATDPKRTVVTHDSGCPRD